MAKKALCLIFALIFSIESFAAIVSDNDGSAFVTKAEFEAMKSDFASQVSNYNQSIEAKVDGAIAAYLAGLQLSKVSILTNYISAMYEQNIYSTAFSWKTYPFTESNNDSFVRGGWWLFFVWGWNLRDGNGNGQINISNASLMDHQLHIYPQSVTSKKYFLKAVEYDGGKYYGPYDHNVYWIDQLVTAQKLTSTYNDHRMPTVAPTLPDLTLDFRALSSSGTTYLGGYNMGAWGSHSNIEGTIILNYNRSSVDRRWACLNAAGICDNATQFYGIDYDERWNLTEEITQSGEIFKGMDSWGTQPQSFNPSTRTLVYGVNVRGMPNVTLYYKIPKVLSKTNAELCNHIASKRINQYVPMYGGLPITNLPGNGKIKFKYRCVTKDRLTDSNVSDTVTIVFKIKQFENVELSAETNKVYEKTINNSDWTTCEFEINDAKRDGSTVLYVKIAPANSENYVRFDIDGAITFTE